MHMLNWASLHVLLFVCSGLSSIATNVSVISVTTVSGCDRELNVHFYSAASLKHHAPDTWHDTTLIYIILTLGSPVLVLPPTVWVPREEQLVPFLITLAYRCPGSNPWPPVPRSTSTDLATATGMYFCWSCCTLFQLRTVTRKPVFGFATG